MTKKIFRSGKGFISVQGFFIALFIYVLMVLFILGFMAFFNFSMFSEWRRILDLEEASIKISTVANNLDACIETSKDCNMCSRMMMDGNNAPFLEKLYQSPNFRYDIEAYVPGGTSCVIHSVKVDAHRFPIYSAKAFSPVSYTCGGLHINVNDRISGVDLCRETSAQRTVHKFGELQDLGKVD